ncbi:MAG: gliding motility-associated C-terminal domain-containing protein, partial [Flavobacteriales bacterium]|nr:gliding motility-associated C-terminal domain-containing protein [Flavobacteriales bacterium]
ATVQAGGGTGSQSDFTYVWLPINQTTLTSTGLSSGIYSVTSSDLNGCTNITSVTISEPDLLIPVLTVTDATCFGDNDGAISVNTTGGTGFIYYEWNPNTFSNPNGFANGLTAGNYSVTVVDQNGCFASESAILNHPTQLIASISTTDATCSTGNGNAVIFNVTGGTTGYSYNWANSSNTTIIHSNLFEGNYLATVTDANGCALGLNTNVVNQEGPIITAIDLTEPLCNGDLNGSVEVSTISGTAPLTYLWSNGQTTSLISTVGAGNYCVSVTDINGCIDVSCDNLNEPAQMIVVVATSNPTPCVGQETTIWAVPSGGFTPYNSIVWSGDGTGLVGYGNHPINMPPNSNETYIATVYDNNGCFNSDTVNIVSGTELLMNTPGVVEICLGDSTTICSSGSGGLGTNSYQWTWSNNVTCIGVGTCCQTVNPTDTTQYMITLEDGCTTPASAIVTVVVNPIPTSAYGVLNSEGCPPFEAHFNGNSSMDNTTIYWDFDNDGIDDHVDTDIQGGVISTPIYTYENSGLYTVNLTVVSAAGCSSSVSIQDYIYVYPSPIASFTTDPTTTTNLTPFVEVDASSTIGGDSLLTWDFDDPFDTDTAHGEILQHTYLDTGHYYIALDVVNVYGCHDYDTVLFVITPDFTLYVPNTFTPDDDGINDGFRLIGIGIIDYELLIFDRWGERIFYTNDQTEEWMGDYNYNGVTVPIGTYVWKAYITQHSWTEPRIYIGHVNVVR